MAGEALTKIRTERSVSFSPGATGLNLYRALWNPGLGEKRTKCPAAFAVERFASSPFNVDFGPSPPVAAEPTPGPKLTKPVILKPRL